MFASLESKVFLAEFSEKGDKNVQGPGKPSYEERLKRLGFVHFRKGMKKRGLNTSKIMNNEPIDQELLS